MKFEEIYEKTAYAFTHDEVYELLTGNKGYSYQAPMVPINVPTHHDDIFDKGIYPIYNSSSSAERDNMVDKIVCVLRRLANSENAVEVWWALSIVFGQKHAESKYKTSPFFFADQLLSELGPNLIRVKSELERSRIYEGKGYENGLWGDVLRYAHLLNKYYDISILR